MEFSFTHLDARGGRKRDTVKAGIGLQPLAMWDNDEGQKSSSCHIKTFNLPLVAVPDQHVGSKDFPHVFMCQTLPFILPPEVIIEFLNIFQLISNWFSSVL